MGLCFCEGRSPSTQHHHSLQHKLLHSLSSVYLAASSGSYEHYGEFLNVSLCFIAPLIYYISLIAANAFNLSSFRGGTGLQDYTAELKVKKALYLALTSFYALRLGSHLSELHVGFLH